MGSQLRIFNEARVECEYEYFENSKNLSKYQI